MRTGRPGPCHLDIPYDLYVKKADVEIPDPEQWSSPSAGELPPRLRPWKRLSIFW